jgi:hypothetical protein
LDAGEHLVVDDYIENDIAICFVVAIHRMKHVTRIDRTPDDVSRLAFARQQANAGRM